MQITPNDTTHVIHGGAYKVVGDRIYRLDAASDWVRSTMSMEDLIFESAKLDEVKAAAAAATAAAAADRERKKRLKEKTTQQIKNAKYNKANKAEYNKAAYARTKEKNRTHKQEQQHKHYITFVKKKAAELEAERNEQRV
jgi:hypothetical protein